MNYCTACGAPVEHGSVFCSCCGHRIEPQGRQSAFPPRLEITCTEPKSKLFCELAYSGTLFWLPLIACPGEKNVRYHANQGLWLLILSVMACTGIRLLSAINDLLAGGLLGVVFGGIYSLLFMVFLFGMLFLLWSAVTRAMAIHRGEKVKPILFFERVPIIHSEKKGEH